MTQGIVGKLYGLADARRRLLWLFSSRLSKPRCWGSTGHARGSISPSEKAVWADRIRAKKVSLSDCQARANGAVIYAVPNQAPAPVWCEHRHHRSASNSSLNTDGAATGTITAAPPAGVKA